MPKFNKPALTLDQQLDKWRSRGLVISDRAKALHYLKHIGYYRFSAYTLPLQDPRHPDKNFIRDATFDQVLHLYIFDRELRLLVLDAIERIEVAIRTHLVNEMCIPYGPHWFMDSKFFVPTPANPTKKPFFTHEDFLDKLDAELGIPPAGYAPLKPHNEVFINHYFQRYDDPYLPPAWMVFEVISMNRLSQIFAHLQNVGDRQRVAIHFGVDEQVLQKWLHCLSYVRNVCAHHRRLWNLRLVIKAEIAKKHAALIPQTDKDKFYAVAIILHSLLGIIAPQSRWHERLANLMVKHAPASLRMMGFPHDWKAQSFWGLQDGEFTI